MMQVVWQSGPPPEGWGKWRRTASELRSQPGRWAIVERSVSNLYANQTVIKQLRKHGCEARGVWIAPSIVDVWARWPDES